MSNFEIDDRAWGEAAERMAGRPGGRGPGERRGPGGRGARARHVAIAAAILGLTVSPFAVAGTGDALREGKRNPSSGSSARETEIISSARSYGTRQSNIRRGNGGGAIYGCRSEGGNEPCVRANNLEEGRAFEFETDGAEAGRIEADAANARPFTTNATAVATGLNADRVDGVSAGRVDFRAVTGTGSTEVLNLGGLVLKASCAAGPDIDVRADTSVGNSMLHAAFVQAGAPTDTPVYRQNNDLDPGDNFDVLGANDDSVQGTLTFSTQAGAHVTVTFAAEEGNGFGGATPCVLGGTALATSG